MNKRLPHPVLNSALVLSASIGITACSGQSFPGSQLLGGQQKATAAAPILKPLKKIEDNSAAKILWQANTGTAFSHVKIHPYVNSTAVYTATAAHVSARNKADGKILWAKSLGATITGGVSGDSNTVFAGTNDGNATAMSASSGEIQWITNLETEVLAVSPSSQGVVVIRTIDGKLHGLSSKNGEILWQRVQRTPALSAYGASVPIIVGDGVVAGFDNGVLAAYRLTSGQPVWEIKLSVPKSSTKADQIIDIDGQLKTLGNAVFAANSNGRIVGIDMAKGAIGWTKEFSSYSGVEATTSGIYSTDDQGNVWRLSPTSGQSMWKQDALIGRQPTAPTLTENNDHIVVTDKQGNLHWISTAKGEITTRLTGDPLGYNTPVMRDGNNVYALGRSGLLTAIEITQ